MKAVLVIDMPNSCVECPCFHEYYCPRLGRALGVWSSYTGKPVDCQLKPLPQKKEVEVNEIEDLMRAEFTVEDFYNDKYVAKIRLATNKMIALGWNACLEEIGGK